MLTLESHITVQGVAPEQITAFMLDPTDERYQTWWPGTHLRFHPVRVAPRGDHVGDVVWMDEYVGGRRLRMRAVVSEAVPGRRIVWRMRPLRLPLPVRLVLELQAAGDVVRLRHALTCGWEGPGRLLDPVWRLYLGRRFAEELDEHARTEFPRLAELLRSESGSLRPGPGAPAAR